MWFIVDNEVGCRSQGKSLYLTTKFGTVDVGNLKWT